MPPIAVIVEDNVTNADIVMRHLQAIGFTTYTAETAEDGRAVIQRVNPSLVVIDERLPDISGTELIRMVREERPEITVVMLTIVDDESAINKAFQAGCNYYAIKPNGFRKLCANKAKPEQFLNASA